MNIVKMSIKLLHPLAMPPTYAHDSDSGMDLYSVVDLIIPAKDSKLKNFEMVSTGIAIELPEWHEAQIRSRSGLAAKYGISVLNSPGTIDESYRGEIKVILINNSNIDFEVTKGMKIAQMVIAPVTRAYVNIVEDLSETVRGTKGFGSTGI